MNLLAGFDIRYLSIFACGLAGGTAAWFIGVPMPFPGAGATRSENEQGGSPIGGPAGEH
ncbi:MAG: hypothetical protein AAF404_22855 [Pseudomonadota bacterium]